MRCPRPAIWLLGFLLHATCVSAATTLHSIAEPDPTYPGVRRIQYGFTIENETNRRVETSEFWAYAPVKQTSTQKTLWIETSSPSERIEDGLGNQVLHFTFRNLPPRASRVVRVRVELAVTDAPNPLPLQDRRTLLGPQHLVEADDPEIVRLASRLKTENPGDPVRTIFRWVARNVVYAGYLHDDRGALYALRNKKGDCTEYTYLFVALSRAAGMPARALAGYVYGENRVLNPNDFHNWAEFRQGDSWVVADPQNRVFGEHPSRYLAFRVIDPSDTNPMGDAHRFRVSGDGLKVTMQ